MLVIITFCGLCECGSGNMDDRTGQRKESMLVYIPKTYMDLLCEDQYEVFTFHTDAGVC